MPHEQLLQRIIEQLKNVQGLRAIVLGGSYASGTQRPDSDLDIGLLYTENQPIDTAHIRELARALNDSPDPTVTDLGGWGPWVNGGAWLTIQGQRVDFLYRNLDLVRATLNDCQAGIIRSDYWQQPAYGFHNFMYCTEIAICKPLYDPEQVIEPLKMQVASYSLELKRAIIKNFLWSARFTLDNIRKPATRGEIYLVVGGLARTIHCLVQVLYALNETYYLSEKRLAVDMGTFNMMPDNFLARVNTILGLPGITSAQLQDSLVTLETLYGEICAQCAEQDAQLSN